MKHSPAPTVTLSYGTLNLRSGPGLEYPIIGSIPNGHSIELLGESGDWYRVRHNGQEGYVSKVFVTG